MGCQFRAFVQDWNQPINSSYTDASRHATRNVSGSHHKQGFPVPHFPRPVMLSKHTRHLWRYAELQHCSVKGRRNCAQLQRALRNGQPCMAKTTCSGDSSACRSLQLTPERFSYETRLSFDQQFGCEGFVAVAGVSLPVCANGGLSRTSFCISHRDK